DALMRLEPTPPTVLVLAAYHEVAGLARRNRLAGDGDPFSAVDGWRPNLGSEFRFQYTDHAATHECMLGFDEGRARVAVDGADYQVSGELEDDGRLAATINGIRHEAHIVQRPQRLDVFFNGRHHGLTRHVETVSDAEDADTARITAPMPGKITSVAVGPGESVERGAVLMVLEAMKMEHSIVAPRDGTIERLPYGEGDSVAEGAELAVYEEE
ncbi:MAG TPA: biotin/lipoyl-containing protein, partial [Arenicellales bacterium]|nr:biotin/lipoyl-containing protein [Arenicellales bacterium]